MSGIARYLNNIPITIVVEPDSAACVMESIKTGKIEKIDIKRESLMGGMSSGEVSLVPWEILKNSVKHCVSLPDDDIELEEAVENPLDKDFDEKEHTESEEEDVNENVRKRRKTGEKEEQIKSLPDLPKNFQHIR